jgi:hypothetical protein
MRGPKDLQLTPFIWTGHQYPDGFLPQDLRAHACWYYYILATAAKDKQGDSIEDQIVLEGEPWYTAEFDKIKASVALLYGMADPAEMDKFWDYVDREARRCKLPVLPAAMRREQRIIITRH